MKRNFIFGLFGGLIGSALLLMLLSAAGVVGARAIQSQPDAARVQDVSAATPLTSTFTYQGQLKNGGNAVNGSCQMAFRLYDDPTASTNLIGSPITTTVPVTNGLFTVGLNFGSSVFNGDGRWLDIQVNCGSGFVALTPRQALTPAPYAFALPGLYTQQNTTSPNIIGGYSGNIVTPGISGATISGGGFYGIGTGTTINKVTSNFGSIGGGIGNTASGPMSTVAGGSDNTASGAGSFVGGGGYDGEETTGNQANGDASTIGGGLGNSIPVTGSYASVGGGIDNIASNVAAFVGGGNSNTAGGYEAIVGGGIGNTASGYVAFVGGGDTNIASGVGSFVGGGGDDGINSASNQASGNASTIGGGLGNTASGNSATVPGGINNSATMSYTLAAGRRAKANTDGTFVWADSTNADFASTAKDQFLVRANGGVGINTNAPTTNTLTVSGSGLRVATNGTTFARIQAGETAIGSSLSASKQVTVTFASAFSGTPKILATVRNDPTWDVGDTFVVTVRKVTTTQFVANIVRVDTNAAWNQNPLLEWLAWE